MKKVLESISGTPLIQRVVKNTAYLFSATGIAAVLGLVQNILTGRLLGVAGIGLLATIIMFTSVINKFASFRMSELVIKYVGLYTEKNDRSRSAAIFKGAALTEILASLVAFALVCLLAPLAAQYLAKDPTLASWFIVYGLTVLFNLFAESSTGLLQSFNCYRKIASINTLGNVATLVGISFVFVYYEAVLPILYRNQGMSEALIKSTQEENYLNALLAVLLAYLFGKAIGALGLTLAALIEATRQWGRGWWREPLSLLNPQRRELVHFAFSTNISATLSLVNKDAELLWISLFRNPSEVGYYKTALSLINLMQMLVSPLPQALYPELAREAANEKWTEMADSLRRSSFLAGTFTLAASLALAWFGRPLILLLYKDTGFLPAYPALLILIPGFLIANTFFWNRVALLALGKPEFPMKVNLALAGAKLLGVLLLVPRFGYLANAALLSGSYLIGVSITSLKTRSVLRKHIQAAQVEAA